MATNPNKIAKTVKITKAQLETIAGGGSVTVGSDTYTADLNATYLTPDDSVSYEAQNLSSSQKAQARTNIGAEAVANKVTSLSNASTDTEYPSAKCVYDLVGDVETLLTTLNNGGGV